MEFIIYGKEDCKYCNKAKNLLDTFGYNYRYTDVKEEEIDLIELARKLGISKVTTVPQIQVVENEVTTYIGGFDKLDLFIQELTKKEVEEVEEFDLGDFSDLDI